jgi:hypothetical protein
VRGRGRSRRSVEAGREVACHPDDRSPAERPVTRAAKRPAPTSRRPIALGAAPTQSCLPMPPIAAPAACSTNQNPVRAACDGRSSRSARNRHYVLTRRRGPRNANAGRSAVVVRYRRGSAGWRLVPGCGVVLALSRCSDSVMPTYGLRAALGPPGCGCDEVGEVVSVDRLGRSATATATATHCAPPTEFEWCRGSGSQSAFIRRSSASDTRSMTVGLKPRGRLSSFDPARVRCDAR